MEVKAMMKARIDLMNVNPGVIHAMLGLEKQVSRAGLDSKLLDLVRMRASQLNGCAYCVDMHTKDARAAGETEQRLYGLSVWRETPYYDERERAALALTDALCRPPDHDVIVAARAEAERVFDEAEFSALVFAI